MNVDDFKAGAEALHEAARYDQDVTVHDLYQAGSYFTEALHALSSLASQADEQVELLPQQFILHTDDGQPTDEHVRAAIVHLTELRSLLQRAGESASRYHAAVGHLGVAVDPDAKPGD
ncbi:hypothetical protein ACQP1V_43045 (plasmid) [Microtetraspora malaysiensis]|uniref:hypothetical protein n=1 Tax=Microtetraspora malaysiensis TaxID=161358 RepID=UPI003D92C226